MEHHSLYGIIHLPQVNMPHLNPSQAVNSKPTLKGCKAELTLVLVIY